MSFTFNWPRFSDQFHYDAIQMLNTALNKGNKPPIIADKIEVVELEMGTQPPELEIRDIGDLTVDQFRGIFRLTYNGDAHLVLKTKVQANPLNHKLPDIHQLSGSRGMLAAKQPLVVPMLLRLSHFRLSSYVVLVVSKQKGITIVFKTDPLQNVDINSTFDSIAVIQSFIQREIEGQLRQMFREDLPSIIHRLSQQWVKAKVETPYKKQNQDSLKKAPPAVPRPLGISRSRSAGHDLETMSTPDLSAPHLDRTRTATSDIHPHTLLRPLGSVRRPQSTTGVSTTRHSSPLSAPPVTHSNSSTSTITSNEPGTFPDLEHFDPTYGLRPEGLPTKPIFKGFSKLFAPNKGLADLAEEGSSAPRSVADGESDYLSSDSLDEDDDYEGNSYDFVEWGGSSSGVNTTPPETAVEYETIPAIGGGTVTRPRVIHAQSQIQPPAGISASAAGSPSTASGRLGTVLSRTGSGSNGSRSGGATPGLLSRNSSNPYFSERPVGLPSIYRHGNLSGSLAPLSSAPPVMGISRRPYSFAYSGPSTDNVKMKQKAVGSVYSAQDEASYIQNGGAVNRYPHPYDVERSFSVHEKVEYEYEEDIDEYSYDTAGPSRRQPQFHNQVRQQSQDDYFSAKPTASSIASSPPNSVRPSMSKRRLSVSSNATNPTSFSGTSPYRHHHPNHSSASLDPSSSISNHLADPTKIVLRPSLLNNSIHHLSTLSHSNHTLSPYTRSFEHFAVRSGPPRQGSSSSAIVKASSSATTLNPMNNSATGPPNAPGGGASGSIGRSKGVTTAGIVGLGAATRFGKNKANVAVKARRKRIFRIGGAKKDGVGDGGNGLADASMTVEPGDDVHDDDESLWHEDSRSYGGQIGMGAASEGVGGKGKMKAGHRRRRSSFGASGTEFDEADMDRYFKSMQDLEDSQG